jgi:RNA polymerase sigma-70 factor (ECF subfamily)
MQLPEGFRIVLLLRDIEGSSTEEAARVMGLTEGAVKVRLHRARAAFKALVEPVLHLYV